MSWTDERVATLTKLWADGLSASQIAGELGGVTRNAVIGKVHRLGLSGRARTTNSSVKRAKRPARASGYGRQGRTISRANGSRGSGASIPSRPAIEDMVAPDPKKISVVELTEKSCKWPYGDPVTDDFYFCGHDSKDDCPYCEYHSRLAYQPAVDRRRDRRVAAR